MTSSSQPNSGPANAVPPPSAAQSPQVTRGTADPVPQSPPVLHENFPLATPPAAPGLQAAQMEHTSSTTSARGSNEPSICALAGGTAAPQSPRTWELRPPAKKRRGKSRDNHISVRFTDDENDVIARRMERTGEKQSDAIRNIVRESEHKTGHVYLAPKAPPEQLETLLGELRKWRRDFATAKPRLNIPTPRDDDSRYAEVQRWRNEADRLIAEIPGNETAVAAALRALTSLTPERVAMLETILPKIKAWRKGREEKGEIQMAQTYQTIIELIDDMGIAEPPRGKK